MENNQLFLDENGNVKFNYKVFDNVTLDYNSSKLDLVDLLDRSFNNEKIDEKRNNNYLEGMLNNIKNRNNISEYLINLENLKTFNSFLGNYKQSLEEISFLFNNYYNQSYKNLINYIRSVKIPQELEYEKNNPKLYKF